MSLITIFKSRKQTSGPSSTRIQELDTTKTEIKSTNFIYQLIGLSLRIDEILADILRNTKEQIFEINEWRIYYVASRDVTVSHR